MNPAVLLPYFFKMSVQVGSSFENATYYMDISAINGLGKSAKLKQRDYNKGV